MRGRSRSHAQREREREETEPKNRLRLTQKPTPTNPENPRPSSFVEQCPNPFVKPRKPIRSHHLRPSSRRSHHRRDRRTPALIHPKPIVLVAPQNRSFSCYFCWVLRIWVLFLLGFDEFGFCPRPASLSPFIEPIPQIANPEIVKPIRHRSSRNQKLSNPFATNRREPRNRLTIRQTRDRPAESPICLLWVDLVADPLALFDL